MRLQPIWRKLHFQISMQDGLHRSYRNTDIGRFSANQLVVLHNQSCWWTSSGPTTWLANSYGELPIDWRNSLQCQHFCRTCANLKMQKDSSIWILQMLTYEHKNAHLAMCQAILTCDDCMNSAFIPPIITMDEPQILFFNPETKQQLAQFKATDSLLLKKFHVTKFQAVLRKW